MAAPVTAGLPPDLDLSGGCTMRLTALNPTTGAVVANVVITGVSIWASSVGASGSDALSAGPFMLVPGPGA